eukprot:TRINITY_DN13677_c0_g1_i1.p1 TRINITY_DN13677_c0_g1~~TRINITY_DN13677_c0_g1_i1.p1  ORF type:complete len:580 (+),score=192.49 TRINITY_DN13677_c0_g1_i1:7-1746(+)
MKLLTAVVAALQHCAAIVVPANAPDVYGGASYGTVLGRTSGHMFAFSGADGQTREGSGFVGVLTPERYGVELVGAAATLKAGLSGADEVVAAASSDVLVVQDRGNRTHDLVFAWSAWDTLVGRADSVTVGSGSVSGGCVAEGKVALCRAAVGRTFAVVYGENATARAAAAADTADVDAVASARLAVFDGLPTPALNGSLSRLSSKAYSVMRVNTLSPEGTAHVHWSTPDKTPHQAMWLWDSCFHAIGRCLLEPALAWEFLYAMISSAAADGHVPIQAEPWNGQLSGDTQPPVLALATWFVRDAGGVNDTALAWALPRLERYIEWDAANRDRAGNGLFEWSKGTESGLDNSPVFDVVEGAASTDFSSYVALEMSLIARMHEALGNASAAADWRARANRTTSRIHADLWDDRDSFYHYRADSGKGEFVRTKTPSGFMPLLLDGMPEERVKALIAHIADPKEFAAAAPLPSVSLDDHTFSTNMWRGPMWLNTNWFTILGLRKYSHVAGAAEAAAKLQQQSVDVVAAAYESYGCVFEFYDAEGKTPPTKCERKNSKDSGGVRDYHWTAALTFWMLHRPNGTLP